MSPRLMILLASIATILAGAAGLYLKGRLEGAARERPKTEAALARAVIAGLETEGARQSLQRVDVVVRQREAARATVVAVKAQALKSEDADAPLAPDRAARLRDADRQLCLAAPGLAGCAENPDAG